MTDTILHSVDTASAKAKAAAAAVLFIAKVGATALGETGGDWVTVSLNRLPRRHRHLRGELRRARQLQVWASRAAAHEAT